MARSLKSLLDSVFGSWWTFANSPLTKDRLMTKLFSAALVLLFSSAAFAYPAIGDQAVMKGVLTQNGVNADITLDRSIVSFDAINNSYSVVQTVNIDGQAQTTTSVEKGDDLISQEQVGQILSFCAMFGGLSETLTVPAGTFATCKLQTKDENDQPDGFAWVGDVAFGIVRVVSTKLGDEYFLDLESFHTAK